MTSQFKHFDLRLASPGFDSELKINISVICYLLSVICYLLSVYFIQSEKTQALSIRYFHPHYTDPQTSHRAQYPVSDGFSG